MLRLGRGTWGFDCVFRHIRVQETAFSFLYTMANTVGASDCPLQPSWRSLDPRPCVLLSPVDFLALSKEIRPRHVHRLPQKRSLCPHRSRRGWKRTLKPLKWVWCWEICGVAFLFMSLISFRARFSFPHGTSNVTCRLCVCVCARV